MPEAQRGADVLGVDISRNLVEAATVLHEVLKATEGLTDMRWYDPDDWMKGREAAWHAEPVDAAASGSWRSGNPTPTISILARTWSGR